MDFSLALFYVLDKFKLLIIKYLLFVTTVDKVALLLTILHCIISTPLPYTLTTLPIERKKKKKIEKKCKISDITADRIIMLSYHGRFYMLLKKITVNTIKLTNFYFRLAAGHHKYGR